LLIPNNYSLPPGARGERIDTIKNIKTMPHIIRYLFLSVLALSLTVFSNAQEEEKASKETIKEQKQWEKEKKKLEKEMEKDRLAELSRLMIEYHRFVLEADFLSNKNGYRIPVSPIINFIRIDSAECTLQVGSAFSVGYNGVGGSTAVGRVIKYEYEKTGKKGDNYQVNMTLMTNVGTYDVFMNVSRDGFADANIRGNWSGQLNYHGKLIPVSLSKVFRGTPGY
jgi:hypothetical protein